MGRVNANIEDAAGTSITSMRSLAFDSGTEAAAASSSNWQTAPSFLVSAFNTHITPFATPEDAHQDADDRQNVAIFVKASVVESSMPLLANLLHTRFPGLVCTVTVCGTRQGDPTMQHQPTAEDQTLVTGTVRLFGRDEPGQLAKIAKVLQNCHATILNLRVSTGFCDMETGDFVERTSGPLAENVISVAVFDQAGCDEKILRREVEIAADEVGYSVSSIIFDAQEGRSQELAQYYLRRKALLVEMGQRQLSDLHSGISTIGGPDSAAERGADDGQ